MDVVIYSAFAIGNRCIINTSSSFDYNNMIEDYVLISSGVSTAGSVYIGKGAWLEIGCVVSNNVNICSSCKLGAGAVVVKYITEQGIYVGFPVTKIE